MKTLTMHTMFAVAALTVAAVSASAQTYKAEVPVSFQAGGKYMPAGTYEFDMVTTGSGANVLSVRNRAAHAEVIVLSTSGRDVPKAWRERGGAMISFTSVGGSYSLGRLWNGASAATYEFPTPHISGARVDTASLVVTLTKGD